MKDLDEGTQFGVDAIHGRQTEALCNRTKNANYGKSSSAKVFCILCKQSQDPAKTIARRDKKRDETCGVLASGLFQIA